MWKMLWCQRMGCHYAAAILPRDKTEISKFVSTAVPGFAIASKFQLKQSNLEEI